MTHSETSQIMAVLSATYPMFYAKQTKQDTESAVNIWQKMFSDEPFDLVMAAVIALCKTRTNTFPPVPGEVSEMIQKLRKPESLTEMEAWNMVSKALRNSSYNSEAEFAKLPPEVQATIGSHNQLREWAMMDVEEVQTVVASNFQRSFRQKKKSIQEFNALPAAVKTAMSGLLDMMHMKSLPDAEVE